MEPLPGSNTRKAYLNHPEVYQNYTKLPGTVNGHAYYVSQDDNYTIYRGPVTVDGYKPWFVGEHNNV